MRVTAALVIGLLSACLAQAQSDSRFDGRWVGTEIVTKRNYFDLKPPPPRTIKTTIVIAQRGTQIGVVGGLCPGRFKHIWWEGNSLNFREGDCRRSLVLSPDGKTLTENGVAEQQVRMTGGGNFYGTPYRYEISGRFSRQ